LTYGITGRLLKKQLVDSVKGVLDGAIHSFQALHVNGIGLTLISHIHLLRSETRDTSKHMTLRNT